MFQMSPPLDREMGRAVCVVEGVVSLVLKMSTESRCLHQMLSGLSPLQGCEEIDRSRR